MHVHEDHKRGGIKAMFLCVLLPSLDVTVEETDGSMEVLACDPPSNRFCNKVIEAEEARNPQN